MVSLRLVVDTNILVSAALKPDGLQRTVLRLAITKPARLYVSTAILTEYRDGCRVRSSRFAKAFVRPMFLHFRCIFDLLREQRANYRQQGTMKSYGSMFVLVSGRA